MNQIKIVEGASSQSLQTKKLKTKYQYLVASKQQDQKYLAYLQGAVKLNKDLINMVQDPAWESQVKVLTRNLEMQRKLTKEAISQQKLLAAKMQEQNNRKEKQRGLMQSFYKSRIEELDSRIQELRGLMAEKESGFSRVLERLSTYEEMKEVKLDDKLDDLEFVIDDKFLEKIKTKLASENIKLAQQSNACRKELNSYKAECQKLWRALASKVNYHRYKEEILKNAGLYDSGMESTAENDLPTVDQPVFRLSSDPSVNSKNMLNLIKKQKLINDTFEREFKELVEYNEDVINYNLMLANSNQFKEAQLKGLKAKISVLERAVRDHQIHFNKTLRRCRSSSDLVYQHLDLIEQQPYTAYLQLLREEVSLIDLDDCRKTNPLLRSYSANNPFTIQNDEEDFFGEIQQL